MKLPRKYLIVKYVYNNDGETVSSWIRQRGMTINEIIGMLEQTKMSTFLKFKDSQEDKNVKINTDTDDKL